MPDVLAAMKSILFVSFACSLSLGLCAAEQVYIACGNAGIRMAEFDVNTGVLSPTSEAISLPGAGFLALHPEKPVLYATCLADGEKGKNGAIGSYQILDNGTLDVLNRSLTQSGAACHVSVDAKGEVVFAASYGSGSVASFRVEGSGSLSDAVSVVQHEGSSLREDRQSSPHAHYMAAGPKNQFAYVPDLGLDKVLIYRFTEDAKLTPAGAGVVAGGAGPRHMKFSKDGHFAYVLNELTLTVTTFRRGEEDGTLTEVATISTMPEGADLEKMSCAEIVVHPNGRYVYSSQRDLRSRGKESGLGRNSLSVYEVMPEGTLKRIQTVAAGVKIPRNFNLHPSGKWLLVGGQASANVQVFQIDQESGELSAKGEPVDCPGQPKCFVFR